MTTYSNSISDSGIGLLTIRDILEIETESAHFVNATRHVNQIKTYASDRRSMIDESTSAMDQRAPSNR